MTQVATLVSAYKRFITHFEPSEFTDWIDESKSWKETCYIGDWSQSLKLRVRGPEAKAFLEYHSTNSWPNFRKHQAKHSIVCRVDGSIMGDGLIMMLGEEDFLFTSFPGVTWCKYQFEHGKRKFNCTAELETDYWYLIQVQGPNSIKVVGAAMGELIRDLPFMNAREVSINGTKSLALRQGVSGERGYKFWGSAKDEQELWKALFQAGEKFGLRQLGMRVKLVNHVRCHIALLVRIC